MFQLLTDPRSFRWSLYGEHFVRGTEMKVEESVLGPLSGDFRWINEKRTVVTNACRGIFNTRQGDTAFKQEQATAAHNVDDSHTQNVEWKKPGRRALSCCTNPVTQSWRLAERMRWNKSERWLPLGEQMGRDASELLEMLFTHESDTTERL